MIAKLLALPFLAVWLLAGVCAGVGLWLVYQVRQRRADHLPYRQPPRACGPKSAITRIK